MSDKIRDLLFLFVIVVVGCLALYATLIAGSALAEINQQINEAKAECVAECAEINAPYCVNHTLEEKGFWGYMAGCGVCYC